MIQKSESGLVDFSDTEISLAAAFLGFCCPDTVVESSAPATLHSYCTKVSELEHDRQPLNLATASKLGTTPTQLTPASKPSSYPCFSITEQHKPICISSQHQ
ncbi:hypothetical protein Nepgr_022936 [Nepenthes gracilis]|uniref:Uncharacterized protein n=1 Tax=Nepenthes gracilis TaxID=150966 RepID=A0AAD3T1W9_NEPGR|nr:hypothetical protein Nepgr_022936 [Nepenthes gracilis]